MNKFAWVCAALLLGVETAAAESTEPPSLPCAVADVANSAIREAFARAVRAPPAPVAMPMRRWTAWVPTQVSLGLRDGVTTGQGYTDTLTGGTGRWAQGGDQSIRLTITWDLRGLVAVPPPPPRLPDAVQKLEPLLKVEQLAAKAGEAVRALRKAQAIASTATAGDPLCREAQGEAEAAALLLDALIAASR